MQREISEMFIYDKVGTCSLFVSTDPVDCRR
jgi:hypothetical protein